MTADEGSVCGLGYMRQLIIAGLETSKRVAGVITELASVQKAEHLDGTVKHGGGAEDGTLTP